MAISPLIWPIHPTLSFITIAFTVLFPDVALRLPKWLLPQSVGCVPNPAGTGYICPR